MTVPGRFLKAAPVFARHRPKYICEGRFLLMLMTYRAAVNEMAVGGSSEMLFVYDGETKLNTEALRAGQDEAAMEEFIRRHRRFILGCAYKTTHRFVSESDDEWSVALIAFHEAVKSYDAGKGNFKSFAALVIRRRLLDYLESQSRAGREITVGAVGGDYAGDDEDVPAAELEVQRVVARRSMESGTAETAMRDEIEAMQQVLSGYGFSFFDLADSSPKARKTKEACARVINALLGDDELLRQLRRSGALPSKALRQQAGVPKKILENHRRYIIAAAEILDGDYPHLAEYLRFVRKGFDA